MREIYNGHSFFFRLISNVIILLEFFVIYEDFLLDLWLFSLRYELAFRMRDNDDINCERRFLDNITSSPQQQHRIFQIFRISGDRYLWTWIFVVREKRRDIFFLTRIELMFFIKY